MGTAQITIAIKAPTLLQQMQELSLFIASTSTSTTAACNCSTDSHFRTARRDWERSRSRPESGARGCDGALTHAPSTPPLSPEIKAAVERERSQGRVRDRVEEWEWEVRSAGNTHVPPPLQEPISHTTAGPNPQQGQAGAFALPPQRGGAPRTLTPRDDLGVTRSPRRLATSALRLAADLPPPTASYPPQGIRSPRGSSSVSHSAPAHPEKQVSLAVMVASLSWCLFWCLRLRCVCVFACVFVAVSCLCVSVLVMP